MIPHGTGFPVCGACADKKIKRAFKGLPALHVTLESALFDDQVLARN